MGVGDFQGLQQALDTAVFTKPPVQGVERHMGFEVCQVGGGSRTHVDRGHGMARIDQRLGHSGTADQRNFPLG